MLLTCILYFKVIFYTTRPKILLIGPNYEPSHFDYESFANMQHMNMTTKIMSLMCTHALHYNARVIPRNRCGSYFAVVFDVRLGDNITTTQ